jgi:phage terminase Nu1 subunit (DNA packaging protein)
MIVSAVDLAQWLNLTDKRIFQLAKEGVVVKVGRNQYDLQQSIINYIKYLRAQAEGSSLSLQDERAKLTALKSEREQLELDIRRGDFISRKDVEDDAANTARIVRDNLLSIADRVSSLVAPATDPQQIHSIISSEINLALTNLVKSL